MTFGLSALNGKRNQRLLNGKEWQKKKLPLNAIEAEITI